MIEHRSENWDRPWAHLPKASRLAIKRIPRAQGMTASSRQLKTTAAPAFAEATAGRQAVAPWESLLDFLFRLGSQRRPAFASGLANQRSSSGQLRARSGLVTLVGLKIVTVVSLL